ncbi:MAG: type II toxin-antitoxin system YafQ family toxin [Proteobacteria bacterium]|nr:type II toxin-antitoxin system YafQ family toxin [Pseudomonadota bacterium]
MLELLTTRQFERDFIRQLKSGKNKRKFLEIINKLLNRQPLDQKHRLHKLKGDYKDCWECHIEPDWLLIYKKTDKAIIAERTGSHAELFK